MQQQPTIRPDLPAAPSTPWMIAPLLIWAVLPFIGAGDLDQAIVTSAHVSSGLRTLALAVTRIGDWEMLVSLTLLAAGWLIYRRRLPLAVLLLGSTLIARLLVEIQKLILARARPEQDNPFIVETSFAYPSGHAANSLVVFVMLALLLTGDERQRRIALAAAVIASLLIGCSRVLLGVHWPTDVIGGWSFGLFWVLLTLRIWRRRAA